MGPYPRITLLFSTAALLAYGADRRQSFAELAAASEKVVLGTVSVKSSYWGDAEHIYTDVLISPDVTIKGQEEGPVTVRILGGTVGDTVMTVSDGPEFPERERVVVFLRRESGRFAVVGRAAGSVRAASAEGASAVENAFQSVEKNTGRRFTYQRGLAARYLGGATARAQTGCYDTDGAKWGAASAGYRIGPTIPAEWAASIDASAATWSGAGAAFRLENDGASVNELSFQDLVAAHGPSYENALAVTTTWSSRTTGTISRATIAFNSKYPWSTAGESGKQDVQNIATHEFGHWMRLQDIYSPSTCADVTMWGSAGSGETKKRTLEQADIDGLLSLYPAGGTAVASPVLAAPANGATGLTGTVTLAWNTAANATSYDVYLGTSTTPGHAGTVTGTSFTASDLTAGATYYWRVVAKNASGSASSGTWSFTVAESGAPAPSGGPTLLSPADGATAVSTRAVFQWTAVQGATSYDFYLGASASALNLLGSVQGTSATVRGFQRGTVYYWKVVARTGSGTAASAVASFQTR